MLDHLPEAIEEALSPTPFTDLKRRLGIGQTTPNEVVSNINQFIIDCNALFNFLQHTAQYDNHDFRATGTPSDPKDSMKHRLLTNLAASAQRARAFAIQLQPDYSTSNTELMTFDTGDTGPNTLNKFAKGIERDIYGLKGSLLYYTYR